MSERKKSGRKKPGSVQSRTRSSRPVRSKKATSHKDALKTAQGLDARFLAGIIERASEGICVCHNTSEYPFVRFTVWNELMNRITGYDMDEINRLGWYQTIYPDPQVQKRAISRMASMREGDDIVAEEWGITRKDGKSRTLLISTTVLGQNQQGTHVMAFMRDITDQKSMEEALLRSEENYRGLFKHTPVAVWEEDFSGVKSALDRLPVARHTLGKYLERHPELIAECGKKVRLTAANQAALKFFRAGDLAALQTGFPKIIAPGAREMFKRILLTIWQGGERVECDSQVMTLEGDLRHVTLRWSVHPGHHADYGRVMVSCIDITDRKQAEDGLKNWAEALRASEEKYRNLFMSAPETITIVGMDGTILESNGYFGYPREKLLGKKFWEADIVPADHLSMVTDFFDKMLKGETIRPFEIKATDSRGEVRWLENHISVLNKDGKPYAVQVISLDVTERKRLQEQLLQAQKMEAIGRLAGGVAHDFNNQLAVIMSAAELVKMNTPADDRRIEHLAMIEKAAEQAASLTRQLLAFSRKQVLEPEVMDLSEVVEGLGKMLASLLGEDISLEVVPAQAPICVKVDRVQIEQVIINLAANARDAMPLGGTLTIEVALAAAGGEGDQKRLSIASGGYAVMTISDTGQGMDEKTRSHIFEPFFTTKERGKGTGLGLATVYGIVKQAGGDISVESELGVGSSFKVFLPRVEADAERAAMKFATGEAEGGSETVIVLEDDERVRKMIVTILGTHGYQVREATGGESALRMIEQGKEKIDLVITDVVMPGMSGAEFGRRAKLVNPELKVLYVSGYAGNVIARHGVLEPGTNFLQKPFSIRLLLRKVKEVIEN